MDIKKKLDMFINEQFVNEKLEDVVGDRFGRYSKYIIQERAIPDVRDGLKPVQRRILFAMNDLGIKAGAPHKKSARICGEVMGKYHPHGDTSIYEAMVRMSQSWKMGVNLIDMHGNNGSIDGDSAAAMRYTEARLSKNADYLLKDIDKNTVTFIPNFDEEEREPLVLPAKFPNLLVNGSVGISSGYATYIPTHNLNEVVNATIALIENPNLTIDELLEIMPGPDFPTGAIVQGKDEIREAFLTGAGAIIVRSKYEIEDMNKEQKRIVVTEIPYDTIKSKTVERIEQIRIDNKVPDIAEVRDESDREGLRIAIDLKKGANVDAILNYLFKNTDLQVRINYNMTSICDLRPVKQGVIPILNAYIMHQKEVITNRTNFELQKAIKRLHIVSGLIKMMDVLDEVIKTIRSSKNKANSKENLIQKFDFSELQAEAIVTMQLYRLSSTDIEALRRENDELNEAIIVYNKILSSEKELLKVIINELKEVNKNLVIPRKTAIEDEISELKIEETDLISKEQVIVVVTKEGYLKRVSLKSFNKSINNNLKENDAIIYLKEVSTLDTLLMFTTLGNYIYLPVYKITECKMKDMGQFVNNLVTINPKEKIIDVFDVNEFDPRIQVLLTTKNGIAKQTLLSDFEINRYSKSVRAMKISDDDQLVSVSMTNNPLEVIVATKSCDVLRFRASDISLYGTQAGGIKAINLKAKDEVISAHYANLNDDILLLTTRGFIKRMKVIEIPLTKRSRSGSNVIKLVKANPHNLSDMKIMTPNQYKENVLINVIYSNGNDDVESFNLKYNVSDAGKSIIKDEFGTVIKFSINSPENPDTFVSGDYLIEVKNDLFSDDFSEKPLKTTKNIGKNILDDLDAILQMEQNKDNSTKFDISNDYNNTYEDEKLIVKETKSSMIVRRKDNSISPSIDDSENEKKEISFKKISLFDEE